MSGFQDPATVTIEELHKIAIESELQDVHTMMPGIIQTYDSATQTCSVQPCPQTRFNDDSVHSFPIINKVPVAHLRAGKAIIHVPLKAGDSVEIRFSERSIDSWKSTGGIYDPNDPRMHALSDAVVYPGLYSIADSLTIPNPSMLTIMNDKAYIEVQPSGKFKIVNSADAVEAFDLLTRLIQAIIDARVETLLGPQPLINLIVDQEFTTLHTLLLKLKGD